MPWKEVTIKSDKKEFPAMQRGSEVHFPNVMKESAQLVIDGKSQKVESWAIDDRDDVVNVMLADAGTKEKSDDKPTEGSV